MSCILTKVDVHGKVSIPILKLDEIYCSEKASYLSGVFTFTELRDLLKHMPGMEAAGNY